MASEVPPPPAAPEPELAPYVIEGARSSRSKCKSCRKKIDKGVLRLGVLIEGPYGIGYLWHHLTCAAKRRLDDVEEAYASEAWKQAKEPPEEYPTIEELRKVNEEAEEKRQARKQIPWFEVRPVRSRQVQELRRTHGEGESPCRSRPRGRVRKPVPHDAHPRSSCLRRGGDGESGLRHRVGRFRTFGPAEQPRVVGSADRFRSRGDWRAPGVRGR